jgi:molecular chaperone GrpE
MTTDNEQRLRELLDILERERRAGEALPDGALLPELSVDLGTLLGQMTALKNEVRRETVAVQETHSSLLGALEGMERHLASLGALERRLKTATEDAVRTERRERIDQLIDLVDRQEAAIQAALKLTQKKRCFFWTANDPAASALLEGLELTRRHLEAALRGLGLERIETVGRPFDAARMEAMEITCDGDVEEGHVAREIRSGFAGSDGVHRFAQVTVKGEKKS